MTRFSEHHDVLQEIEAVQTQADCLLSSDEVHRGIAVLAQSMSRDLAEKNPVIICVMNGGLNFCAALLSHFSFPLQVDHLHLSRYRGALSGSHVQWLSKPSLNLKNRVVVLLDDILDQGLSLQAASDYCQQQGASEIFSAVLVKKNLENNTQAFKADFVAFECEDRYLFGFGMDYKNYLRNAPGIYALNVTHNKV